MRKLNLFLLVCFISMVGTAQNPASKKAILKSMKQVADWQIAHFDDYVNHPSKHKDRMRWAWTNGAMYVGMLEWAKMSKDEKYFEFLKSVAEKESYNPGPDVFHADDICVSWLYISLFEKYKDSVMIKPTHDRMGFVMENRSYGNLDFTRKGNQKRWSWCDALFMAPPVYVNMARITGDSKYLDFMDEEFKVTYDTLYDKKEKLFFRDTRFKTRKEANGEKIFWGRGNGWVIGGLCLIIDNLPANHPTKPFYTELFKEMMERIARLQDKNGFWHPSLLDPVSYPMPESSSSAFFTYGLAWGINNGLLPAKTYKPVVYKAWKALNSAIHPDGKLGWVQPIGADPKSVTADMTEVYGVGAFLLAGSEMYKMK